MNTVTIQDTKLPVVEYQNLRVVTLAMIDEAHQRPEGTARRNFNEHRDRFIEGEDFFLVSTDEIRTRNIYAIPAKAQGEMILLTQQGYLMVTKPFKDDLAWQVQRQLINGYFRQQTPKTQNEIIAAMALANVEQERRLSGVESKIDTVVEKVEQIRKGTMRNGYVGYRQLVSKSGMTDAKCRNLVNAYRIPTDTHEFMTPEGLLSRRVIVEIEPFMKAFRKMMSEAEQRNTKWYHPKMGLFQVIGWEAK